MYRYQAHIIPTVLPCLTSYSGYAERIQQACAEEEQEVDDRRVLSHTTVGAGSEKPAYEKRQQQRHLQLQFPCLVHLVLAYPAQRYADIGH